MIRIIAFLVLVQATVLQGQIQSIGASGDYVLGLSKRLNVQKVSGVGSSVEVRIGAWGNYLVGIRAGYTSFSLDQTDQLNQWNWNFWNERYYPKIQSDMRADPNLTAVIGSVQTMDVLPVMLSLDYRYAAGEQITIFPGIGGGAAFFTRKLYADETWTKQFPQANYTLTYNLRNFAPGKKGTAAFVSVACDAVYRLSADFSVVGGLNFRKYVTAVSGTGEFPFTTALSVRLGLNFNY